MDENEVNQVIDNLVNSIINSTNFTSFINALETLDDDLGEDDDDIERILSESLRDIDYNMSNYGIAFNFGVNYGSFGRIDEAEESDEEEKKEIHFTPSKYTKNQIVKECSICIVDFDTDDEVVELNCKHIFHLSCITEWCQRKPDCPNCRLPISQ